MGCALHLVKPWLCSAVPDSFVLFCSYLWPSVHTSDLCWMWKEGQVNHCKLNLPIGQWFAKLQNLSLRSNDVLLHIRPECCTTSILSLLATLATLLDFCLALNQLMQEIPSCFSLVVSIFAAKLQGWKLLLPQICFSLINFVFNLKNNPSTCSGTAITVLRISRNFPETDDNGILVTWPESVTSSVAQTFLW